MMRKLIPATLIFLLVLFLAFSAVLPAYAHGGEPRLEISMERINPGGVLEVRGVEFDYDEPVVLTLMRSEIQIPLMDVVADGEGIFTQVIVIPPDLPPGEYTFRARSEHHEVLSPLLTVWGAALSEVEDSGVRDQSDLQLGSLPTVASDVVSTDGSEPVVEPVQPAPQPAAAIRREPTALVVTVLVILGLIAAIGAGIARKRSRVSSPNS